MVTHEHSTVVAGSDYYPFGLPMDGREITDEPYRWGYQGQYAQENDSTGWNEFQLRMYDARFGRWLSPDPYGQFASPYLAMGNMPHMGTDPDGGLCCGSLAEAMSDVAINALADASAATATRIVGSTLGTLGKVAALELNINAPEIELSFDAEYQEYSFSGTFEQYQQRYPHFSGMTASEANEHWQDYHRDDFFNEWAASVQYERGQIAVQKMSWFALSFSYAGSMSLGALGGSANLARPTTFNYTPRGMVRIHGNSLASPRPTWGYKLYSNDGTFLKNGITSRFKPELRYTKGFMEDKYFGYRRLFPNRRAAYQWEFQENQIFPGPLNRNMH